MEQEKNIFISHHHSDVEKTEKIKAVLEKNGLKAKDGSINQLKNPNKATNEEYIKSLLRSKITWASTMLVLIGDETHKSDYVTWEIEYAAKEGKRIIGIYLHGEADSIVPEALKIHGDALVLWDSSSIIKAIQGEDIWNGIKRDWETERSIC